ncbi:MAG TPA: rRNA maturation RNase YbeY, partial [Candidatus Acidoferrales bacterium]|nr:rRNA maturation RNase YbeY [Candidatus Acidoferrales bacterium]
LVIANRQRRRKINSRLLREIVGGLLAKLQITDAELGINLVAAREMALVNETFLNHTGSTDVITFDHRETVRKSRVATTIHGELFVCVDDAIAQAKEFKTNWQSEVVRYIVHGVLHLLGYDDLKPQLRRTMKREENRLVRLLADRFALAQLARTGKISA